MKIYYHGNVPRIEFCCTQAFNSFSGWGYLDEVMFRGSAWHECPYCHAAIEYIKEQRDGVTATGIHSDSYDQGKVAERNRLKGEVMIEIHELLVSLQEQYSGRVDTGIEEIKSKSLFAITAIQKLRSRLNYLFEETNAVQS